MSIDDTLSSVTFRYLFAFKAIFLYRFRLAFVGTSETSSHFVGLSLRRCLKLLRLAR